MRIKSVSCLVTLVAIWIVLGLALVAIFFIRSSPLSASPRIERGTPASGIPLLPPIVFATPTQTGAINFSGRTWLIKAPQIKAEPGPSLWSSSSENVWVDNAGRLHLRVTYRNGLWYSGEVFSEESFGYGTYRFSIDTDLTNLDPDIAAGFFTWSEDSDFHHREIDLEFSIWTNLTATKNAQYVVQPYTVAQNIHYFVQPTGPSIHTFTWQPKQVSFASFKRQINGTSESQAAIGQWSYAGTIPHPAGEKVHMNFWTVEGKAPKNGQEAEMIVSKFEFTPANQ